jgi:DNA adenine methylase
MKKGLSSRIKIQGDQLEKETHQMKADMLREPPPALLKWIGSKQQTASIIVSYIPQNFKSYIESFLGSGAVLGTLAPTRAIAGDSLKPLIEIWKLVQDDPKSLLDRYTKDWNDYLKSLKSRKSSKPMKSLKSAKETYKKVKDSYNKSPNPYDLLFISRSCYGGVIRFTKAGEISTPIGAHKPISPASLRERIEIWRNRTRGTIFICADFSETMEHASEGDIVYCDPPYQYSQQILYGSQNFRIQDLWDAIRKCKERGAKVMLSIDGKVKSEQIDLKLHYPEGLFEHEILIPRGSSMLKRFQKKGLNMEGEAVHDRLLLTWTPTSEPS